MAPHNGRIERYEISEEIQKHIFKKIDMLDEDGLIDDYLNERIAYIYYHYDSKKEMIQEVKKFNDEISIIFKDE